MVRFNLVKTALMLSIVALSLGAAAAPWAVNGPRDRIVTLVLTGNYKSPRLLAELIQSNLHMLTPYYQELLEEGNRDGSLHTEYPRELAELLPFLTSVWLMPAVFPASKEEIRRKFAFLRDMLERLGVPLFDESLQSLVDQFFDQLPELE